MNNGKYDILVLLNLTLTMIACQSHNFNDNLRQCSYYDLSIDYDKHFYHFDTDSIDIKIATKSIYRGIEIDTFQVINHDNDTDFVLKIHDSISEINFYRFNIQKPNSKYSLFEYNITSNLIKYRYGIQIGMKRKVFFKNLGIPLAHCDSFMLCGKSNYYYFFIFKHNELKQIERKMPTK